MAFIDRLNLLVYLSIKTFETVFNWTRLALTGCGKGYNENLK